ncbi:MAG: NAD(+) diphosphatase [Actinomycetota bacterium]|nr:NAD(+) diphosphatase [Actinomycetota bacterium]
MPRLADPDPPPDPPSLPFATAPYDRQAERRADPGWWDRLVEDPAARVLVVGDDVVATDGDRLRELTAPQAVRLADTAPDRTEAGVERMLLGADDDGPLAAISVPQMPEELAPQPVRTVAMGLDALQGSLLVHALGLANWHRTHQFCARCGARSTAVDAGHRRQCPRCGTQHFPRTDPAVIMAITDTDDRLLLGHSPLWPDSRFSTLAGFVEPGESLEDAVRREVVEETGVVVGDVTYAASQPWPFPASLMLGFFGQAATTRIEVDGEEVSDARWFTREALSDVTAAEQVGLPGPFSISRWLIERWHGGQLSGQW